MSAATPREFAELLLEALDAQVAQQAKLAAISEAQTGALATRDVESVDALTRALEAAVLDGSAVEQRRAGAAAGLAASLGLDPQAVTLRELVASAPGSLSEALQRRSDALARSIERLRRASAVNKALIEGELAVIDRVMRVSRKAEPVTYSERGNHDERLRALLDARA